MELSSVFGGDSLKASDLQGREPTVTIATVQMKKFDSGNKLVITFIGKQKALVCNKTNANRIAYAYGTNTDHWIGQQIQLYTDLVDYQGKPVEAIRVRPPMNRGLASMAPGNGASVAGGTITTAPQRMAQHPLPDDDRAGPSDEIPF